MPKRPNVQVQKRAGKDYYYHRKTRARLPDDPNSAAFVRAWNREEDKLQQSTVLPGTLGGLMSHYRRSDSFAEKAPRTQKDYGQVMDALASLSDYPLVSIDPPGLVALRDKVAKARGFAFANKTLAVLSVLFGHGKLYGMVKDNPATGVPHAKRPKGRPDANRPWTDEEVERVLAAAPPGVRAAVALGAYAAVRGGDALVMPWSAIRDGALSWRQGKTGDEVWLPVAGALDAVLRETPRVSPTIVTAERGGKPYTPDGFRTVFGRLRDSLEASGEVGPGLTFHGLRHTAATNLADLGCDDATIAAVTGHKSLTMVRRYTVRADKRRRASAAIARLDGRGKGK